MTDKRRFSATSQTTIRDLQHPDAGGDPEDFKRLRGAYDEGLRVAKK